METKIGKSQKPMFSFRSFFTAKKEPKNLPAAGRARAANTRIAG